MAKKMLWGRYLSVRRKHAGFTSQEKLAAAADLTTNMITRWEKGDDPKMSSAQKVAAAFGEELCDFIRNVEFRKQGAK